LTNILIIISLLLPVPSCKGWQ